jgi:Family of unknown function (DUF6152)
MNAIRNDEGAVRMIRSDRAWASALFALALAAGTPAFAHHSFAPYEPDVQIQFTGIVTDFQWTNPHVYIELDVRSADGETKHWLIEGANPGILNRIGWKWNMIKAGDEISVIVSPLRNGDPAALLKAVRLPDGTILGNGGPAGPARIPFDASEESAQ